MKRSNFQQIPLYSHIVLLTLRYLSNIVRSTQTDTDSLRLRPNRILIHKTTRIRFIVPDEVVARPSHGHSAGFAGERAGKQYPLPWFPLSDDPSRYRYRTTAGCRPCRSSPWNVDVVAVEVVHFLRLSFVFGIGDGAHGGWLAHAGCLFSAVDLTVLPSRIWRKSLPRFILKRCSGCAMQYRKSGAYQKKYSRSCASVCIKWLFVPMRNGRFNNRRKFFCSRLTRLMPTHLSRHKPCW